MNEKDFRKLKRVELYEIMLAQAEEIDDLRAQLAAAKKELENKRIDIQQSGSIAEASLKLTKVFEEAQKVADLYLSNIKRETGDADE
jgi:hypothetical protein